MATSLPSVEPFLEACATAIPVLRQLNNSGRSSMLSVKSSRRNLTGEQVVACIEQLKGEATRLKDLQDIVRPFVGLDLPYQVSGGLLSAGMRNGTYTPEKFLATIGAEFDNWTYGSGHPASQLKCDNGFLLYNLAQEFQSFELAATALNSACGAGEALLAGSSNPSLEREFKTNLRRVLKFQRKEFAKIKSLGAGGRHWHFVMAKREIYNNSLPELKRLAEIWESGPADIVDTENIIQELVERDQTPVPATGVDFGECDDRLVHKFIKNYEAHWKNDTVSIRVAEVLAACDDPERRLLLSNEFAVNLRSLDLDPEQTAALLELMKMRIQEMSE